MVPELIIKANLIAAAADELCEQLGLNHGGWAHGLAP